jgi:hypothetical protein
VADNSEQSEEQIDALARELQSALDAEVIARLEGEATWRDGLGQSARGDRVADRFTAEQIRGEIGKSLAFHYQECGCQWCAKLRSLIAQAADTEEVVERIASAEPALVEAVKAHLITLHILAGSEDVAWFLRALAAVLKGEATNG